MLWWAYLLVGPGRERLLVLAAGAEALHGEETEVFERIAPGFAPHTDFPGAADLARRLPVILPSMSAEDNAGHIPPVLVRAADGRGELLELPTGAPIGVGGVPFEAVRVRVEPGDRLVMCTDGLVEVRGEDTGVGLAALCESAAHPAASMDDACDTIIRALAATFSEAGRGGLAVRAAAQAGAGPPARHGARRGGGRGGTGVPDGGRAEPPGDRHPAPDHDRVHARGHPGGTAVRLVRGGARRMAGRSAGARAEFPFRHWSGPVRVFHRPGRASAPRRSVSA